MGKGPEEYLSYKDMWLSYFGWIIFFGWYFGLPILTGYLSVKLSAPYILQAFAHYLHGTGIAAGHHSISDYVIRDPIVVVPAMLVLAVIPTIPSFILYFFQYCLLLENGDPVGKLLKYCFRGYFRVVEEQKV